MSSFRYDILTLFPGLFAGFLDESLLGKARAKGLLDFHLHNFRDFATDKHNTVDDAPFGGGAGLVLKPDVMLSCVRSVQQSQPTNSPIVALTPAGRPFDQATAERWADGPGLTLLCGRYEGFDARIEDAADELVSLGDYVLNGGEVAAMAIIEATARLRPGVVGNAASLGGKVGTESHSAGLLEHPHYTRPRIFEGAEVPAVLLSGDHGKIAAWRQAQAELRTQARRPDLWDKVLSARQSHTNTDNKSR
ncbi:MAG: tRNA (guanosine(37)-N1)-methyltransferase TrmD [Myxococcales bacterium]|nr:tRNA (guanosine(37)-N1)-methyltransferase TrmD [Myxococcales bacterium]